MCLERTKRKPQLNQVPDDRCRQERRHSASLSLSDSETTNIPLGVDSALEVFLPPYLLSTPPAPLQTSFWPCRVRTLQCFIERLWTGEGSLNNTTFLWLPKFVCVCEWERERGRRKGMCVCLSVLTAPSPTGVTGQKPRPNNGASGRWVFRGHCPFWEAEIAPDVVFFNNTSSLSLQQLVKTSSEGEGVSYQHALMWESVPLRTRVAPPDLYDSNGEGPHAFTDAKTDFSFSLPEGDVPSLQQDFSVLLPHLQQHVKQLRHGETITLQKGWRKNIRAVFNHIHSNQISFI